MMLSNTPNEIVAELRMSRVDAPSVTFVLLEGPTDKKFWAEYIAEHCRLFHTGGKDKAVEALQIIMKRKTLRGVAAILDPDYWLIEQSDMLNLENLLVGDVPDLELMLITSPAFEKVLRHTIAMDAISEFSETLRNKALRLAMEYGCFRLINLRHSEYNLSFNRVSFAEVIDHKTLQLDRDLVAEKLVKSSAKVTKPQLLKQLASLSEEYAPNIKLCRGHDVLSIIAYILPILFKSTTKVDLSGKSKIQTRSRELSRTLRMAYEYGYFTETSLFSRIREWESDNPPYRIICQEG